MTIRERRSLEDIQRDYRAGLKKPLEDLMRAWRGIKELPAEDQRSFFKLAGYHGEPFRGGGWGSSTYWGGYCNHGNVLFPTWHRVYLFKLEEALRSIAGCEDVCLPFWDETSEESLASGIPWALTDEFFELDGSKIPNPLRSFIFPVNIVDHLSPFPDADYGKPKGYETVRYPLSGLVGANDIDKTKAHNAQYPDWDTNVTLLNHNVVNWLTSSITVNGRVIPTNVHAKFIKCLDAPNYTVFSNTTSAAAWNDNAALRVTPLESPHNSIHLAVGGYDIPNQGDFSPIDYANGDMGENDTAGFDPIFYFHHCFIDRVFWLWQKRHDATDALDIIPGYPGTNSIDNQGPTPGTAANSWLTLDSPLDPFMKTEGGVIRTYTSRDCINIETQLGYSYGAGSLDSGDASASVAGLLKESESERAIHVSGINRGRIKGSFLISAFATVDGERQHIGTEAVLSRWHVEGCSNCQTHLQAGATFGLTALTSTPEMVEVEVHTRDGLLGSSTQARADSSAIVAGGIEGKPLFRIEVR